MSIERRVDKLAQQVGVNEDTIFLIFSMVTGDEDGNVVIRKPTKKAIEKARKEALEKNPGQPFYWLDEFDDYYRKIIPRKRWASMGAEERRNA